MPLSDGALEFWLARLRIFICVVKPQGDQSLQKEVPSTEGMKITLATSDLMRLKLQDSLSEKRLGLLTQALEARDFLGFAEITIRESNTLHAVCLDTYPAIFYMNETSRGVIKACTRLNAEKVKAAYSIDAGFHVFVFALEENAQEVLQAVSAVEGIDKVISTRIGKDGVKLL